MRSEIAAAAALAPALALALAQALAIALALALALRRSERLILYLSPFIPLSFSLYVISLSILYFVLSLYFISDL